MCPLRDEFATGLFLSTFKTVTMVAEPQVLQWPLRASNSHCPSAGAKISAFYIVLSLFFSIKVSSPGMRPGHQSNHPCCLSCALKLKTVEDISVSFTETRILSGLQIMRTSKTPAQFPQCLFLDARHYTRHGCASARMDNI